MRLALFGGTFDPIHRAHLRVAEAAVTQFQLDRVLFAPAGRQPLKNQAAIASYRDRLEMVRLALAEERGRPAGAPLVLSEVDAPRADGQPNYTADTLEQLARLNPGAELFAIAGADSFLTLPSWRFPGRLLELAQWIVVSRPGFEIDTDFLARAEFAPLQLSAEQRCRVQILNDIAEDVSATELRRQLREQPDDCPASLPLAVFEYIQAHGLYR